MNVHTSVVKHDTGDLEAHRFGMIFGYTMLVSGLVLAALPAAMGEAEIGLAIGLPTAGVGLISLLIGASNDDPGALDIRPQGTAVRRHAPVPDHPSPGL